MKLTFRFISGLLQPFSPKYLSRPDTDRYFNHVSIMEPASDGTFDPDALYIGSADKIRGRLPDNYIVIGNIDLQRYPSPQKENLSVVISGDQTTAGELIALIGNSFLTVGSMADDMLRSLSNSNHLPDLINISYKYLGNPIVITDTNWKALCMAPDMDINDKDWMLFRNQETLSSEVIAANIEVHPEEQLHNTEMCLYLKDKRLDHPRLMYNVWVEDIIVGTVSVLEYNRKFTAEDYVLLPIISNAISTELQKMRTISFSRGIKYEELLADMLDGKLTNIDIITSRLKNLNAFIKKYFYLLVFDLKNFDIGNYSLPFVRDHLEEMVTDSKALIYKETIVLFKSYDAPEEIYETIHAADLTDFLERRSLRCGVSRCFTNITEMPAAFSQATAAIDISNHFGMSSMICMYEKYAIYHIAGICGSSTDISRLLSPKLKELMEYDHEHNVSFTKTLECYFRHSRNITDTAAALNLHRNSVVYHLNKIQDLLGFSFSDSQEMLLLELSLRLNDYKNRSLPDNMD